jgi:hypothetical protein
MTFNRTAFNATAYNTRPMQKRQRPAIPKEDALQAEQPYLVSDRSANSSEDISDRNGDTESPAAST